MAMTQQNNDIKGLIEHIQNVIDCPINDFSRAEAIGTLEWAKSTIQSMRDALEFYADDKNYKQEISGVSICSVASDGGEIAKEALESLTKEK